MDAYFAHFLTFLFGLAGGYLGGMLYGFAVSRACRKLNLRLNDVEDRLLTLNARKAATARWDQDQWEQEALKSGRSKRLVPSREFDNDPLPGA